MTPEGTYLLFSEPGLRIEVEHDVDQSSDDVREESSPRHFADQSRHHLRDVIGWLLVPRKQRYGEARRITQRERRANKITRVYCIQVRRPP